MALGHFITFEGGEGCGKSTQVKLLSSYLTQREIPHITTREPGGTPGAEAIRNLLVQGEADKWDATTETFLFMAARRDHVEKRIKPALQEGKLVLCDRFSDSTLVYQGISKFLGVEFVRQLQASAIGDFAPTLTFILDIDPETGLKRAAARHVNETRFEGMDISFHKAIREGFLQLAKLAPARYAIIDAAQTVEQVQFAIRQQLSQRLGL